MQPAGPVQNPQFAQPSKVCVAHFCLHAVHKASACCLPARCRWQGGLGKHWVPPGSLVRLVRSPAVAVPGCPAAWHQLVLLLG